MPLTLAATLLPLAMNLSSTAPTPAGLERVLPLAGPAQLLHREHKTLDLYPLCRGPMRLREAETADEESGYQGEDCRDFSGQRAHALLDFPRTSSALSVATRMKAGLRAAGYTIVYECGGPACGDAEGWRAYLDSRLAGSAARQHYLIAETSGAMASRRRTVVFYVHDLGPRPRASLDLLEPAVVGTPVAAGRAPALAAVHFALGNDRLDGAAAAELVHMAEQARSASAGQDFILAGYSDGQGGLAYNLALSRRRAEAVRQALASAGIPARRLRVHAIGPLAEEQTPAPAARRVELRLAH